MASQFNYLTAFNKKKKEIARDKLSNETIKAKTFHSSQQKCDEASE